MQSVRKGLTLALADVFANDSDNEQKLYGFSDNDISDHGNKASKFKMVGKINISPSLETYGLFSWCIIQIRNITLPNVIWICPFMVT